MTTLADLTPGERDERWKPIPGYEGLYEISDRGNVRSVGRTVIAKNGVVMKYRQKPLKQALRNGYLHVSLRKDGKQKSLYTHRLVLQAFVGAPPEGFAGCHQNGIRTDNRKSNLRWDTQAENNRDMVRHKTHGNLKKTHCKWGHKLAGENLRKMKNGRGCVACHRARGYIQRHPELKNKFQELSDSYYEKLEEA